MTDILGVVCARLNSSRLPAKHMLDLAGEPMIARIFQRLEQIPEFDQIVLATTGDEYNQPLVDWAKTSQKDVFAFDGDVDDLVGRVDALVEKSKPQIVVYFCGDSPLIEPTTVSHMIQALLAQPDADYVCLKPCAQDSTSQKQVTIHEGFTPYRYAIWKRMVQESKTDKEREHVGLAKNKFIQSLQKCEISDDPVFCRLQHRISVDTPSDYRFMSEVYQRWYAKNAADTLVSLPWVIEQLEKDPQLKGINAHVRQKGASDQSLSVLLVTQCGREIGLGHLMRMIVLANTLQDTLSAGVRILVQGEKFSHPKLDLLPCHYIEKQANLIDVVEEMTEKSTDVVIFDLASSWLPVNLEHLLTTLSAQKKTLIGIDGLFEYTDVLDFIYVPSFYLAPQFQQSSDMRNKISYGWQNYLLPQDEESSRWRDGNKLLVLTGGSDANSLGEVWPELLDEKLPEGTEVQWVQGPFSGAPNIPENSRLKWICHHSPDNLKKLMTDINYALTLHGVSFFELLQLGVPTVTLAVAPSSTGEIQALAKENVAVVTGTLDASVNAINELMRDASRAQQLSNNARSKMSQSDGGVGLANRVADQIKVQRS